MYMYIIQTPAHTIRSYATVLGVWLVLHTRSKSYIRVIHGSRVLDTALVWCFWIFYCLSTLRCLRVRVCDKISFKIHYVWYHVEAYIGVPTIFTGSHFVKLCSQWDVSSTMDITVQRICEFVRHICSLFYVLAFFFKRLKRGMMWTNSVLEQF